MIVACAPLDDAELARWTVSMIPRGRNPLTIRPLRPDDRERDLEFVNSLSDQARYMRLLSPMHTLPQSMLEGLMDIDYRDRMAFVAVRWQQNRDRIVAVARYARTEPGSVEFAIAVADAEQRSGVGSEMLRLLMQFASERGFAEMYGIALVENAPMRALARKLGFQTSFDTSDHLIHMRKRLEQRA